MLLKLLRRIVAFLILLKREPVRPRSDSIFEGRLMGK